MAAAKARAAQESLAILLPRGLDAKWPSGPYVAQAGGESAQVLRRCREEEENGKASSRHHDPGSRPLHG